MTSEERLGRDLLDRMDDGVSPITFNRPRPARPSANTGPVQHGHPPDAAPTLILSHSSQSIWSERAGWRWVRNGDSGASTRRNRRADVVA